MILTTSYKRYSMIIYVYSFILFVFLTCSPYTIYGEIKNECEKIVHEVMGEMWEGKTSSYSIDKALNICLKFANEGNAIAQNNMGLLHMIKNNNKDSKESYDWILKAANNGNTYSQFHMGLMHEEGIVVNQDFEKADYWYQKAAQCGLALAQRKLGYNYTNNIPDGADFMKGINWYEKAASQGDAVSITFLIQFYSTGTDKFPPEKDKAKHWAELYEKEIKR